MYKIEYSLETKKNNYNSKQIPSKDKSFDKVEKNTRILMPSSYQRYNNSVDGEKVIPIRKMTPENSWTNHPTNGMPVVVPITVKKAKYGFEPTPQI